MILSASLLCAALVVHNETRDQPLKAQQAALLVTENRRHLEEKRSKKPVSVCKIIKKPHQYSWYRGHLSIPKREKKAWLKSIQVAKAVRSGSVKDFTHGALFFNTKNMGKRYKTPIKPVTLGMMMFY